MTWLAEGRVAVVTGAASGLGAALAEELARRGARVALVDLDRDALDRQHARLTDAGHRVSAHVCDVADPTSADPLVAAVLAHHGAVHLVIHNAGVTLLGRFEETDPADLDWILGVNLRAAWSLTRAFLPALHREERAHLVTVSSVLGLFGAPGQVAYCTTKAAIAGFGKALREELRGSGVGVTVVYAGALRTGIVAAARSVGGAGDGERRQRLHGFLSTKGGSPHRAARRILRAVERRRGRVLVGRGARWLDLLDRLVPGLPGRFVSRDELLGERRPDG